MGAGPAWIGSYVVCFNGGASSECSLNEINNNPEGGTLATVRIILLKTGANFFSNLSKSRVSLDWLAKTEKNSRFLVTRIQHLPVRKK